MYRLHCTLLAQLVRRTLDPPAQLRTKYESHMGLKLDPYQACHPSASAIHGRLENSWPLQTVPSLTFVNVLSPVAEQIAVCRR
jgi:hypothetical protein